LTAHYGQSDRFAKTVAKIAVLVGQDYKSGGITRMEVRTQTAGIIQSPLRPQATIAYDDAGQETSRTQPEALDISDYQSEKKVLIISF
jgi:hypothetical protein